MLLSIIVIVVATSVFHIIYLCLLARKMSPGRSLEPARRVVPKQEGCSSQMARAQKSPSSVAGCKTSGPTPSSPIIAIHQHQRRNHHQYQDFILYLSKEDHCIQRHRSERTKAGVRAVAAVTRSSHQQRNRHPHIDRNTVEIHNTRPNRAETNTKYRKPEQRLEVPPLPPREQRLPTPELSDVGEDEWWGTSDDKSQVLKQGR